MQSHSVLARLQQVTTLSVVTAALAWLGWQWRISPGLALAGFVFIACFHAWVLAAEFLALRMVDTLPDVLRPTVGELFRAWWGESLATPRVFCWRQPFRWRDEPDQLHPIAGARARRGIVLVHGLVCNRGFWTPWMKLLRARGHTFAAVNLEPVFGSIDDYVPIIDEAVERVSRASGMAPILVCHSMGGLAARAWLCKMQTPARVDRVVTIASPHHGTWLAQFSHLINGRQMRREGDWLRCLGQQGAATAHVRFTCWYSNCDNVVFPTSTATMPGADNRLVRGVAHVELAFHPDVIQGTLALIDEGAMQPPR